MNYWINGIGHGCCYQSTNINSLPSDVLLKYILSNNQPSTVNPFEEVPFNGTIGGYSKLTIDSVSRTMNVLFYDQENRLLYESSVSSRQLSSSEKGSDSLNPVAVTILSVVVIGTFLLVLIGYFYKRDSRSVQRHAAREYQEREKFLNYSPIHSMPGSLDTTRHETELTTQHKPLE